MNSALKPLPRAGIFSINCFHCGYICSGVILVTA